jgi:hypothetical protein
MQAGASMVELGNYDSFYGDGITFSAEDVLQLTHDTRFLLGNGIPLSVTVPHTLDLPEQVRWKLLRCYEAAPRTHNSSRSPWPWSWRLQAQTSFRLREVRACL